MLHQQPDSRREFDLYDPDALRKDKPARVSDDDPRYIFDDFNFNGYMCPKSSASALSELCKRGFRSQKLCDNFFLYFVTSSKTPNEEHIQNLKFVDFLVWTL